MSGGLSLGWRLRAAAAVLIVPPLLYFISFARLATWLGGSAPGRVDPGLDDAVLARWVDRLLRNLPGPWHRTCLKRSAVLYHLLRRAGRPVELCIGVRSEEPPSVAAHAWLVRGGSPYLEARPEHAGRHTVIARFSGDTSGRGAFVTTGRLLFDTLRFHGAPPSECLAAAWAGADVRGLPRLVALEGCAIWAYRRLRQVGALDQVDRGLADWLASQMTDQTARNLLIDSEADALTDVLRRIDVPAVFMKGVARRLLADRFPLADARSTHDVDLIVPAERAWEVWHELRRLGYERTRLTKPPRPEHHHLPALMCERRVGVEIHTTHAQGIPAAESWRRLYTGATEVVRGGRHFSVPAATELFWNGTAHALRIPDVAFILGHLLDTAVIWASGTPLDWQEIVRRLDAKEIMDTGAAGSWLRAAADLAGVTPPPELESRLEAFDLPRALDLRLAVLRRVPLPAAWNKLLIWWSSERARRVP